MRLRPVEPADVRLVADWLARDENARWLDFGGGQRALTTASLWMMAHRRLHVLRLFMSDAADRPIGLVALSDVDPEFRTARLWYVLGDKAFAGRGCTSRAVHALLNSAFGDLGLEAINAWTVECNAPSIRVLERNRFRLIGRQRRCHRIDGRTYDRLLFDLLATEHEDDVR